MLLLWIIYVISVLFCYGFMHVCLLMPCIHLLGKVWPLGSRLWFLFVALSLSHWYHGSGVVLDCIDSWSLPSLTLVTRLVSFASSFLWCAFSDLWSIVVLMPHSFSSFFISQNPISTIRTKRTSHSLNQFLITSLLQFSMCSVNLVSEFLDQIFLLVDLREFFSDLGSEDEKKGK